MDAMIRTVLTRTSLVRLRTGLSVGRAVVSWPETAIRMMPRPPSHFSRHHLSVATTEETSMEVPETPEPTKKKAIKKKTKNRRARRPTKQKAHKLFDEIAPHMPLKTLSAILRKLKLSAPKICSDKNIITRVGQVHALLETAKIPMWAQQRFTEFLLNKPFRKLKDADDFAVNVNKASLDSHVNVLMKARDLSAQRPLLWSITQRRKISQRKKVVSESESADDLSSEQDAQVDALTIHKSKSEETRRDEAKELVTLLAEKLPEKAYHDLMQVFASYVEETTNPKKPKLRMLWTSLSKCVSTHIHFVADDVANFFYVDHSTSADPRLGKRAKEWDAEQDQFVETMFQIYDALKIPSTNPLSKARGLIGENADMLGELDILRTRPSDGVKVGRDREQEQAISGRRRKNVHLVFDAMLLIDEWEPSKQQQYVVFVDNMPIDMEETDLFDLYSRCGPVQSVQIFNRREELDPGPLSAKKRKERKVQERQSMWRNRRQWKRPRTPVYGQITFTSQEGYESASDAPLRIFGMVIRKHPMRTIRPMDMTSLYLEDIPEGTYSLDIEHKLSQLLHPEIYVCLNIGQHDFAEPSSIEIRFPSFEMAQHAFYRLQDLDMEGASLHWMRTPHDATKYWTRDYSFET